MKELHVQFKGIVQNVGFRAHIQKAANKRNITGYVKNLKDGSVELVAQGEEEELQSLFEEIKNNPGSAKIDSVKSSVTAPLKSYNAFSVQY
ncbi:MAG: acyl-phosphate glycerol 3-phosphate acyltransferase [Chlamydiae bacterium CG10_big_fil_rev_8_21_14_0_10_35_9]|nr:MAG: acyl-phosphate glycerol 3-phosphate acyltransferase [Chlamydiae bacterium CG10_big_fil_rev_8_21_14_0_10_35_9]